ncbi:UDP-N-acetylglucosamine 2-epimerase [Galbibacter sp. EGI 63066]|uniref:UDP-N-acetylglucosamine 2-epimerase n=1 Tax=Galbibacter sp. EGI 63066 TaxID=2993559 RepID=UPI002249A11A|nr:UDP-N-acetylglucosamine 2-epimerase [Galbibacter sp. EGI 63066]MCX2680681.1 UDP-N-acetylglucosamine 2-epimerase [Galbibacter sp. EGI 63066]
MKVGVLTSSRADYGIYLPLLKLIKEDSYFELEIIAFGTHLSKFHGYTVEDIYKDGYSKIYEISSILTNDNEVAVASAYGLTVLKFSEFWAINSFDIVFCLGDRFEMSAAVQAGIPFGVRFAHIHGGETTLGAIDNIYRHQITLASSIHFTAAEPFSKKIASIIGNDSNIFTVGSLSLDDIDAFVPIAKEKFYKKFNLRDKPFILVTFHPETVSVTRNVDYAIEMKNALDKIIGMMDVVITMPNADTEGTIYRKELLDLKKQFPNDVKLIESFGKENYFTAMTYAEAMVGNTSSGIIEAASFKKYVVNVGDRQKGRLQSMNILNAPFDSKEIYKKINKAIGLGSYTGKNVYFRNGAAKNIVNTIKKLDEKL